MKSPATRRVMAFSIHKVQVWSGELSNRPGAAAAKLEFLARAGADLEFVFSRPHSSKPETDILFAAHPALRRMINTVSVAIVLAA